MKAGGVERGLFFKESPVAIGFGNGCRAVCGERICKSLKTREKKTDQNFRITQIHLPLPSLKNSRVSK